MVRDKDKGIFDLRIYSRDIPKNLGVAARDYLIKALNKVVGKDLFDRYNHHEITIYSQDRDGEKSTDIPQVISVAAKHLDENHRDALKEALPGILAGAPGRKMRWGKHEIEWYRPIDAIVATFSGELLDFSFGHIKSIEKYDLELHPVKTRLVPVSKDIGGGYTYVTDRGEHLIVIKEEEKDVRYKEIEKRLIWNTIYQEYGPGNEPSFSYFPIPSHCDEKKVKAGYKALIKAEMDDIKAMVEVEKNAFDRLGEKQYEERAEKRLENSIYFPEPDFMSDLEFHERMEKWSKKKFRPLSYAAGRFPDGIGDLLPSLNFAPGIYFPNNHQVTVSTLCVFFCMKKLPWEAKYDPYGLSSTVIDQHKLAKEKFVDNLKKAAEAFELSHEQKTKLWKFVIDRHENFLSDPVARIAYKAECAAKGRLQHFYFPPPSRMEELEKGWEKKGKSYETVIPAYKRIWKVLKKNKLVKQLDPCGPFEYRGYYEVKEHPVDEKLFETEEEKLLHDIKDWKHHTTGHMDKDGTAFLSRGRIDFSPIVEGFFNNALVMHEDPKIRNNRLALLAKFVNLIHKEAHLYYFFEDIPR